MKFELWGVTYNRVLQIYLSPNDLQESWVVLQSAQYGQIHILKLRYCLKAMQEQQEQSQVKTIGGQFIACTENEREDKKDILFKITEFDNPQFWDSVKVKFTLDGLAATILTSEEAYMLILDPVSEMYLKYANMSYLNNRRVQQFNRGDSRLLFVDNDSQAGCL